jgi:glycine/D-amino acid oxidase-like deaminating enzyme
MVPKTARILVVGGGGTMGSSTALHLARRGYTDIRVLDVYESPSANSAGNDLNKVSRRCAPATAMTTSAQAEGVLLDQSVVIRR